jgi:hypothetical protein
VPAPERAEGEGGDGEDHAEGEGAEVEDFHRANVQPARRGVKRSGSP